MSVKAARKFMINCVQLYNRCSDDSNEEDRLSTIFYKSSAKERFYSFCLPGKNWVMPSKYKTIFDQFQKLDELLSFFKSKGHATFWSELTSSFNSTLNSNL